VTSSLTFAQLRLAVATTYPEPAIVAIARHAAARGELVRFYTTLRSAPWMAFLARWAPAPGLRAPIRRELVRRSLSGLPGDALVTISTSKDLLHRGARLLPGSEAMAQRLEYRLKETFDRDAARLLGDTDSNAVITMAGSAQDTLLAARRDGRLAVLHMVNNHPGQRNRCMKELGGLPVGHHELVPEHVARRVTRELELADLVLVPSRAIARQLLDVGVPGERILLQPYGVDATLFHPGPDRRMRGGTALVLFVGNVCHGKGIRFLIEAARHLRSWPVRFLLIGPLRAPELLRGAPDNVEWMGGVVHDQVAEAMRRADLFVVPSIEDAYPLVTLEAMASGLPVIVSDHAGTSELVTPGVDGLIVKAGETPPLVAAIERLIEDDELRLRIGQAGRQKVVGHTWDAYAERVLNRLQLALQPVRPLEAASA
jgi:glycosyltransferase involved in cell wall biosynthesis